MPGYISKETVDLITNTADLVSIIGEYTKLEKRGPNDWWGCCPFHGEKTASFHIIEDKKYYYCFGCHKGGTAITFLMEMEKLSFSDTILSLAKKAGIQVKYEDGANAPSDYKRDNKTEEFIELYERTASMFHYMLLETEQGKKALEYITSRGLTKETIEKFKLGYSPENRYWLKNFLKKKNYSNEFLNESGLFSKNYPDVACFSDRLMFPIFNRKGQVVAFGGRVIPPADEKQRKYLNSSDMPQFKKRETLFGFNFAKESIRKNKKIIFCEGNMDVIAYHQCELDYAVATLGTAMTEEHIKMIQGFVADGFVLLSFDSDGAGQEATKRAILLCRKHDLAVKVIKLKGGKDPAEIMLKYGKDNLTSQVNNAILDSDYFLLTLGEKYPLDTPDGKAKAVYEYFEFVNSLQSSVLKESCLEKLSQAYNLKPEAVKKDFINQNQGQKNVSSIRNPSNNQENTSLPIKQDAELRGLIAVTTKLDSFKHLRENLSEDDFINPAAKRLFKILDDCYSQNSFTIPAILTRCNDRPLEELITNVNSSGIYKDSNIDVIVDDTIKMIKKNKMKDKRAKLVQRIREFVVVTEEDKHQLDNLLKQKMELDQNIFKLLK